MRRSGRALVETASEAISLGTSKEMSAPVLLAISELVSDTEDFGWLFALSEADGDIVLKRIQGNDGNTTLDITDLYTISANGVPQGQIAIAVGPQTADTLTLGVAYRHDCLVDARVRLQLFELTQESDGAYTFSARSEPVEIGGERNEGFPTLAYSAETESWMVAYRISDSAIKAKVLSADGAERVTESYVLFSNQDSSQLRVNFAPLALGSSQPNTWFSLVAYLQQEDNLGQSLSSYQAFYLGCL
jgi:hypothetical protein